MKLTVVADQTAIAEAVADRFVAAASGAIEARGRFTVALSGGATPKALYGVLRSAGAQELIDWASVECFIGDERMVPASDDNSNLGLARRELFAHLERQPVVYPVATDGTKEQAADRYAAVITEHVPAGDSGRPRFDLVLLGLGGDGHTASLFPGFTTLGEDSKLVVGSAPGTLPPPVDRVSFALPLINAARNVIIMAAGPDKREALGRMLEELDEPVTGNTVPAARVRPSDGSLEIVVDTAATGSP